MTHPGAALRTCRTDLVAQVWYNMLVSHRFTPEGGRSLPAPRHSGAGRWQAVVGAKRTPYGTQRAFDTLTDVL